MFLKLNLYKKVALFVLFILSTCFLEVSRKYILIRKIEDFTPVHRAIFKNQIQWEGTHLVDKSLSILVLAGHADSQGNLGAGTQGEAVSLLGENPMNISISDELFWNLKIQKEVVKIGQKKGLNINSYDPGVRYIKDPDNPISNWSVGAKHALKGGYAIEIHFDSFGKYGIGSGLIPPINANLNTVDEALAVSFGRFPILFRGGLGAPKRKIRVLEIGKLEGSLERDLRNLNTREKTIKSIANKIVNSIIFGLNGNQDFNQLLDKEDIFFPAIYL